MDPLYFNDGESPFWHDVRRLQGMTPEKIDANREWIDALRSKMIDTDVRRLLHEQPAIPEFEEAHQQVVARIRRVSQTWGARFREGPPWKGQLVPMGCREWIAAQCGEKRRRAAEAYCNNIYYVPHDQFVGDLVRLYRTLPPNAWFAYAPNNSSEFILAILSTVDPTILDRVIVLTYLRTAIYQLWHLFQVVPPDQPVDLVWLDDMAYSAGQMMANQSAFFKALHGLALPHLPIGQPLPDLVTNWNVTSVGYTRDLQKRMRLRIHLAFTYMTEKAIRILSGQEVYAPFDPDYVVPLWGSCQLHAYRRLPSLRKAVGEDMFKAIGAYFGYPSRYSEEQVAPDGIVYFDHKIADEVSTIGLPLLTGRTAPGGENAKEAQAKRIIEPFLAENLRNIRPLEPEPWVLDYIANDTPSCDHKVPLIPLCERVDHADEPFPHPYPDKKTVCPLPWYKRIQQEGIAFPAGYAAMYPKLPIQSKGGRSRTRRTKTRRAQRSQRSQRSHRSQRSQRIRRPTRR
jgi:hypothetical protein